MFPEGFLFGACVSDYQHFGNNLCDWPSMQTADHGRLFRKDFEFIKKMGLTAFRTSVEWSKVEPYKGEIKEDTFDFYHRYFKELKATGVETFVTLHHFTNPRWVHQYGGWTNASIADKFVDYAKLVAERLGDYIDHYIVLNEPSGYARSSYITGQFPPKHRNDFSGTVKTIRNMAKANSRSYDAIKRTRPNSKIGVAYSVNTMKSSGDILSNLSSRAVNFIDSKVIGSFSKKCDFIGINYYAPMVVDWRIRPKDFPVYPDRLPDICGKIYRKYRKPVIITENGMPTNDDSLKAAYMIKHLEAVERSIASGVDIQGYLWWSFLHGYEWISGFGPDFSLITVDIKNLERKTTGAADTYSKIIAGRTTEGMDVGIDAHKKLLGFKGWPRHYYF